MAVELAIIISMSLYSPVLATYRLEHTPKDLVARTLSAWSIGSSAAIAILTALGGLLADVTSPRTAITVAGLLILASPLLLPRRPDANNRYPGHPACLWRTEGRCLTLADPGARAAGRDPHAAVVRGCHGDVRIGSTPQARRTSHSR